MVNHTAIPHVNQTDVDICPEPTDRPTSVAKVKIWDHSHISVM